MFSKRTHLCLQEKGFIEVGDLDGVHEYFKDLSRNKITLLTKGSLNHDRYFFIIVPKNAGGAFLKRSNETKVELLF